MKKLYFISLLIISILFLLPIYILFSILSKIDENGMKELIEYIDSIKKYIDKKINIVK